MDKEKLLLVGAGGFGRVSLEIAERDFDCRFIDDGVEKGTNICGVQVIGTTDDLIKLYGEFKKLIVTIGNNQLRDHLYKMAVEIGYTFPTLVHSSAYISPYAKVGDGCVILNNAVIQNGASVGSGVIVSSGVEIHHDSEVGNNVLIYSNTVIRSLAKVGDRAHIGSTLTISNGVQVHDDQVVENGQTILKQEQKKGAE